MFRVSLVFACIFMITSCSTSIVRDSKRASKLNAELGVAYMRKGNYEQSLFKLKKAMKLNPDNARAFLYTAELYRRLNENESALDYFKQAYDIAPDDSAVTNNYGAFLCSTKKYTEAFKFYNLALLNPVYPDRAEVYENMGICAEDQGNIKLARYSYSQATSLKPYLGTSLLSIARIDYDANDIESSNKYLAYYQRVAKPNSASTWLGVLLAKKSGDTKTVESLSWALLNKFPKSKEAKILKRLKRSGKF